MVFLTIAAFALLPVAIVQGLTVNTPPNAVVCQPLQFQWQDGTPAYFLSLNPAGQSSAPAIKQFPTQNGNTLTWTVDLPKGTTFTIVLKDSTGTTAFSDIVTVQDGPDSSCINTSVTEGGTGGSASATSAGGATGASSAASAPAGTTSSAGAATTSGSSAKPASSSAAAASTGSAASPSSTTKNSNSASNNKGNALAVAGVMGLVGAALF